MTEWKAGWLQAKANGWIARNVNGDVWERHCPRCVNRREWLRRDKPARDDECLAETL